MTGGRRRQHRPYCWWPECRQQVGPQAKQDQLPPVVASAPGVRARQQVEPHGGSRERRGGDENGGRRRTGPEYHDGPVEIREPRCDSEEGDQRIHTIKRKQPREAGGCQPGESAFKQPTGSSGTRHGISSRHRSPLALMEGRSRRQGHAAREVTSDAGTARGATAQFDRFGVTQKHIAPGESGVKSVTSSCAGNETVRI